MDKQASPSPAPRCLFGVVVCVVNQREGSAPGVVMAAARRGRVGWLRGGAWRSAWRWWCGVMWRWRWLLPLWWRRRRSGVRLSPTTATPTPHEQQPTAATATATATATPTPREQQPRRRRHCHAHVTRATARRRRAGNNPAAATTTPRRHQTRFTTALTTLRSRTATPRPEVNHHAALPRRPPRTGAPCIQPSQHGHEAWAPQRPVLPPSVSLQGP